MQEKVFDTSVFYVLLHQEPEYKKVEQYLNQAKKGSIKIGASELTLMELEYGLLREQGEEQAQSTMTQVQKLPVEFISISRNILTIAARFKAGGGISVADAIIAATAHEKEVPLLTKEPEFAVLRNEVAIEFL